MSFSSPLLLSPSSLSLSSPSAAFFGCDCELETAFMAESNSQSCCATCDTQASTLTFCETASSSSLTCFASSENDPSIISNFNSESSTFAMTSFSSCSNCKSSARSCWIRLPIRSFSSFCKRLRSNNSTRSGMELFICSSRDLSSIILALLVTTL